MNKRQAKKKYKKGIKACEEAFMSYEEAVKAIKAIDWQRVGEIIAEGLKKALKECELYIKEFAEQEENDD
jgi:hypothetical protein